MKKIIIILLICLSLNFNIYPQIDPGTATQALLDGASSVTKTDGGYTYVVVIQSTVIVILLFVSGYLFVIKRTDDKETEAYLRNISKDAIVAVIKNETVLTAIKEGQERLNNDHIQIKDGISQIKGGLS